MFKRFRWAILCGASAFAGSPASLAEENASTSNTAAAAAKAETIRLTIHPKAESKPSLGIQWVPDATEQLEGNAAVYYLKAMGFLEQGPARDRIREILKKGADQAKATGKDVTEFPPYSYIELRPKDYPVAEVKEYLKLVAFQESWLREARRMRDFSMHRHMQLSDNPVGYLLPEMQSLRDLARNQSMRCRLAIAENRIDDAIEIIGQQVTMSRHIGMDDFLISYLIGCAVLGVTLNDTMALQEHPDCPNLYWAFAQLPNPLTHMDRCLAFERQFVFLQVPKLKEVDTTPKPPAYWTEFVADFSKRTSDIDDYADKSQPAIISKVQGDKRVESIRKAIEANVPQAKEYLLGRGILTENSIGNYPKEQLVFLAMKDYYEVVRDEQLKWLHVPYHHAHEQLLRFNVRAKQDRDHYGWFTAFPNGVLPAFDSFHAADTRARQRIALVMAIEAIRMAGAENGGKLIDSLDKAPVPIPNDPFTGSPFSYHVDGDVATLSSEFPTNTPLRIELQFAR